MRDDYGKLWFNIIDYTGSATRLFTDPAFDGEPARLTEEELNEAGETIAETEIPVEGAEEAPEPGEGEVLEPPGEERRKFYFDGGQVAVAAHLVYELDPSGAQLRVVRYTEYAAESVRSLYPTSRALRAAWMDAAQRSAIVQRLAESGISCEQLAEAAQQPEADPFDLLCHLAFNAPLRTRQGPTLGRSHDNCKRWRHRSAEAASHRWCTGRPRARSCIRQGRRDDPTRATRP